METRQIRHIGVFSVAKFCATISLVLSFIAAILSAVLVYFGIGAIDTITSMFDLSAGIAALVFSLVIAGVGGLILGFIAGVVGAVIYNIAAGISGGIEIDLD